MDITKKAFKICNNNGYTLKLADKEEIEEILELYRQRTIWFKEKGINQWQKYLEHHNKDEFLKAIESKELFVLVGQNKILGCFEISEESKLWNEDIKDSYYIYKIVTKVGTKGIGGLIFDVCTEVASANKKKYLKIDCIAWNTKLNDIYQSYGFDLVKTDTKDYYTYNLRRKLLII